MHACLHACMHACMHVCVLTTKVRRYIHIYACSRKQWCSFLHHCCIYMPLSLLATLSRTCWPNTLLSEFKSAQQGCATLGASSVNMLGLRASGTLRHQTDVPWVKEFKLKGPGPQNPKTSDPKVINLRPQIQALNPAPTRTGAASWRSRSGSKLGEPGGLYTGRF